MITSPETICDQASLEEERHSSGSSEPLAQCAYSQLVTMLIQGKVSSGAPIREAALCQQLKLNRSAVREALNQLVSMDVLEYTPYCGYRLLPYTVRDVIEWLQYRQAVEPMALKLFLRSSWIARLERMAEMEKILKRELEAMEARDTRAIANCDYCFHLEIVEGSCNRRLSGCYMRNALPYLIHLAQPSCKEADDLPSISSTTPPLEFLRRHTHDRHVELLREMREGEPAQAILLLRRHLRFAEEGLREDLIARSLEECPAASRFNVDSLTTVVKSLIE